MMILSVHPMISPRVGAHAPLSLEKPKPFWNRRRQCWIIALDKLVEAGIKRLWSIVLSCKQIETHLASRTISKLHLA